MSQVFFDELGIPEPRTGSTCAPPTPTRWRAAIAGVVRARAAGLGARLRRHELDASRARAPRATSAWRTSRPACAASTSRCRRSETGSRSTGSRRSCSAPTSARRRSSLAKASRARPTVVGDVMADATRIFAPIARERAAPRATEPTRAARSTAQANTEPDRLREIVAALARARTAVRVPGPPADPARARCERHRAAAQRRSDRAARLPGDARARRRRRRRRHRLRRAAEGGVLAARPLRDAAAEHRVGGHGRRRRERARRDRRAWRGALAAARFPAGCAAAVRRRRTPPNAIAAALYA